MSCGACGMMSSSRSFGKRRRARTCGSFWSGNRRRGSRAPGDGWWTILGKNAGENGRPSMTETRRRTVTIANPNGLHMRPAAAFAELAAKFNSSVKLARDAQSVDGKNWLELLLLAAEPGTELTLEVAGPDAAQAI